MLTILKLEKLSYFILVFHFSSFMFNIWTQLIHNYLFYVKNNLYLKNVPLNLNLRYLIIMKNIIIFSAGSLSREIFHLVKFINKKKNLQNNYLIVHYSRQAISKF